MSDLLVAGGGDAGLGLVRPLQPLRPPAALLLLLPLVLALTLTLVLVLALVLVLLEMLVWYVGVLHLRFPEAAFLQEALIHLQFLARLLPAVAALHLQLLDAHLDVLDVVCRDPRSSGDSARR